MGLKVELLRVADRFFSALAGLTDPEEKRKALDIVMEHYAGKSSLEYSEEAVNNAAIIKVEIESMTGKKSGY